MIGFARWLVPVGFLIAGISLWPVEAQYIPSSALIAEAMRKPVFRDADEASAYLKESVPTSATLKRVADRLREFGDDRFDIREAAYRDLLALGPVALIPLLDGTTSTDPEVLRQVMRVQSKLKADEVRQKQFAALETLERYRRLSLPQIEPLFQLHELLASDAPFSDAIQDCLTKIAPRIDGSLDRIRPLLRQVQPRSRIVALQVLAKAFPQELKSVGFLIEDPKPEVRFHALWEFLKAGDKTRVPAFIGLYEQLPFDLAMILEDQLCRLYEGEKLPAVLMADTPEARRVSRDAWLDWWNKNGDKIEISRLSEEPTLRGLTLIGEVDGNPGNRVFEVNREGKKTWELKDCGGPVDLQPLPNGNVLIAEYYTSQVTERNRKGDIVWKSPKLNGNTTSAQRLPNGNTLTSTHTEIAEFDRQGNRLKNTPNIGGQIHQVHRDKRGHLFVLNQNGLIEYDTSNKQIAVIAVGNLVGWGGFQVLPNRHFMIAHYSGGEGIREIDYSGKIIWEAKNIGFDATRIQKLRNGNVLIAGGNRAEVVEFDSSKKIVWRAKTEGRPFAVVRY